jgi:hypothetical protein
VQHLPSVGHNCFARLPKEPCVPLEECELGSRGKATVDEMYCYFLETKKGDCGLPLTGNSGMIYGFMLRFTNCSAMGFLFLCAKERCER